MCVIVIYSAIDPPLQRRSRLKFKFKRSSLKHITFEPWNNLIRANKRRQIVTSRVIISPGPFSNHNVNWSHRRSQLIRMRYIIPDKYDQPSKNYAVYVLWILMHRSTTFSYWCIQQSVYDCNSDQLADTQTILLLLLHDHQQAYMKFISTTTV